MANLDGHKYPLPGGTRGRNPTALIQGKEYTITGWARLQSKFPNKDGSFVHKLVAVFVDFKDKFHLYMPNDYNDKSDDDMDQLIKDIKNENLRIVFYGQISNANIVDILRNNETMNTEKLQSIKAIEASEMKYGSKRSASSSSSDSSPFKKHAS